MRRPDQRKIPSSRHSTEFAAIDQSVIDFVEKTLTLDQGKDLFTLRGIEYGKSLQHYISEVVRRAVGRRSANSMSRLADILLLLRIYGIDHFIKLLIPSFRKSKPRKRYLLVFFTENFIPHILDVFIAIFRRSEKTIAHFLFLSTDIRAIRYVRRFSVVDSYLINFRDLRIKDIRGFFEDWRILKTLFRSRAIELYDRTPSFIKPLFREISRVIRCHLGSLPLYERPFKRVMDRVRPSRVIFGCDAFPLSRIMIQLATSIGAETFTIQHGLIGRKNGYLPVMADKVFVWSDLENLWFCKNGVNPSRVIVTGCPKLNAQPVHVSKNFKSHLSILVASGSFLEGDTEMMFQSVKSCTSNLSFNYTLRFRPHPYFRWEFKESLFKKGTFLDYAIDERTASESLSETDILISEPSSFVLEAAAAGIPVILFSCRDVPLFSEIYKVKMITEPRELVVVLERMNKQILAKCFDVTRHNYGVIPIIFSGDPAERILAHLHVSESFTNSFSQG